MVTSVRFAFVATFLLGAFLALPARAEEALDPSRFDPTFKGLTFGAQKAQVVDFLKKRIDDRYEKLIQGRSDIRERDRLEREKQVEVAAAGGVPIGSAVAAGDWVAGGVIVAATGIDVGTAVLAVGVGGCDVAVTAAT